jgi:hypothetical protein
MFRLAIIDGGWRHDRGNPSLAEAGDGHPTDRGRQAVPGAGGRIDNNSATSVEYMKPVWPKLAEAKLNTVLAGVSWAQIEPQEGKFDFSVLDGVIRDARSHNLRLVLLWFASWKNGSLQLPARLGQERLRSASRAPGCRGKSIELLSTSAMPTGTPMRAPLRP